MFAEGVDVFPMIASLRNNGLEWEKMNYMAVVNFYISDMLPNFS